MTRTCPTGSSLRLTAARDSGTYSAVRTMAATPIGMLTQNTPRQPTESTRAPPMTGPVATDRPNVDPQKPIALARSLGSVNVLVTIDIATGLSIEPPTACSARNATRAPRPGATLHASEPTVKTARPIWNPIRRPTRSATDPDSISSEAITSMYASTVHCRPETDEWKSRPIDGSATLTMVASMPTMNRLMQQMASTR